MVAEPSLDPFALIRGLVAKVEKGINEAAGPIMGSGEFSRAANRLAGGVAIAKKLAQDLTQRYFEALNVPSRADLVALDGRLQALEDRLINLQATLDQMRGPVRRTALPAPSRTRKPPAVVVIEPPAAASKSASVRRPARTRKATSR